MMSALAQTYPNCRSVDHSPETIKATSSAIGGSSVVSYALLRLSFASLACIAAFASDPLSASGAAARRSSPDQELARCIKVAAGGRPWLEKTLWGLRDQEGGWIGAVISNANGSQDLARRALSDRLRVK